MGPIADLLQASPSEATPVLLELAAKQAARRRPADVLAQFTKDPYVAFAALDQRTLHRLDGLVADKVDDYWLACGAGGGHQLGGDFGRRRLGDDQNCARLSQWVGPRSLEA